MESYYTRGNFPQFIGRNGPWDICANEAGQCAAIPRDPTKGHKPSGFGNIGQARKALADNREARALAAMRRYRQNCFASDPAARAIKRLVRTDTWRGIVAMREARAGIERGRRFAGMGY